MQAEPLSRALWYLVLLHPCWVASVVSNSLWPYGLFVTHQAPQSMGFSRQGYWSGLSCPPPGDLPDQGSSPCSSFAGGFFITEPPGKPIRVHVSVLFWFLFSYRLLQNTEWFLHFFSALLLLPFRSFWKVKIVEGGSRGRGHVCVPIADSCWCMAETNTN